MRIIIASHNQNKIKEFKELLEHEVVGLSDINYHQEIIEDGESYIENATIKVKALVELFPNDVIIGDDSGFSIKALQHKPGLYSARYMSHLNDYERNLAIIELLKDNEDRKAFFTCAMVLYYQQEYFVTQEVVYGTLPNKVLGNDGFGYDSIFIPNGSNETFAQNPQVKQQISHRAKAIRKIIDHVHYLQD